MTAAFMIVDGTAIAYRAFYAIQGLTTSQGTPTNALFGFIKLLQQQIGRWNPSYVVVTFDGGIPEARKQLLESYKAQRPPMPDALAGQLAAINEYVELSGISTLRIAGQEADDLMATLAKSGEEAGNQVLLVTSDKDMLQLVNEKVTVVAPTKSDQKIGPNEVLEKMGVPPNQIVECLALVGDSADNIPGIPGVGPKTAAKWLQQYGSLEGIWEHRDELAPPRMREAAKEHWQNVLRNVELIRLRRDINVPVTLESLKKRVPDRQKMDAFLDRYELHSLKEQSNTLF